jgi:hypothetical protein
MSTPALANHPDTERDIREFLKKESISNLDQLISRAAATPLEREAPLPLAFTSFGNGANSPAPKPHRPPQMDWYLDGQRHDPAKIGELNGQALHSTPGSDAKGNQVLHSFTSVKKLYDHLQPSATRSLAPRDVSQLPAIAVFYSDINFGGDRISLDPGYSYVDLTKVHRGFLHLQNWNDIISCVAPCRWDIMLLEDINGQGSRLYLNAGGSWPDLTQLGWNDRASMISNVGARI